MSDARSFSNGSQYALALARAALGRKIESYLGRPIELKLNNNRRTYFSASFPPRAVPRVSLHRCFASAPDDVVRAVAQMLADEDKSSASEICRRYVTEYDQQYDNAQTPLPASLRRTRGKRHDLAPLAEAVNQRFFDGKLTIRITWGRRSTEPDGSPRRRHKVKRSIRFASYDRSLDLVRINRILDSPDVPEFYLDFLIYHELLHKVLGVAEPSDGGRRRIHHPEFLRREKAHPHYQAAMEWEKVFFQSHVLGRGKKPPADKNHPQIMPVPHPEPIATPEASRNRNRPSRDPATGSKTFTQLLLFEAGTE